MSFQHYRCECYSLIVRLHMEGILQGSPFRRNILWQPGPLTKPPEQRSRRTPSFRIIDFGRSEKVEGDIDAEGTEYNGMTERKHARRELLIGASETFV